MARDPAIAAVAQLALATLAAFASSCAGDGGGAADTRDETSDASEGSADAVTDAASDEASGGDEGALDTDSDTPPDAGVDLDAVADASGGLDDDDLDPTGGAWSALFGAPGVVGGTGAAVLAAAVGASGDVYVGGAFERVGGVDARNIARWDGRAWHALGDGVELVVHAIALGDADDPGADTIHVAGTASGGGLVAPPNQLHRWDGEAWQPLGDALDPTAIVHDLAWVDGRLWLGGDFGSIGEIDVAGVARWDGAAISRIEAAHAGANGVVHRIFVRDGEPCLAGAFDEVLGVTAGPVACRGAGGWSRLGEGLDGDVRDVVALDDGRVIAGGELAFPTEGGDGDGAAGLAVLADGVWTPLAGGVRGGIATRVRELLADGEELVVGGQFTAVGEGSGAAAASNVARLSDEGWSALGAGVVGAGVAADEVGVFAMAPLGEGGLLVGGRFALAGDVGAGHVARWEGDRWDGLVEEGRTLLGAAGQVFAFATDGTSLYVGGLFAALGSVPAQNVARWESGRWQQLGGGLPGDAVRALAVRGGQVLAGGAFREVGSGRASFLARWDGAVWAPVEPQLDGVVRSVAVCPDGGVAVAGDFTAAGGQRLGGVALWRGGEWEDLGGGLSAAEGELLAVRAVVCNDDNTIIVGGQFGMAGGEVVRNLGRYRDGRWSAVGGAPDGAVDALALHGGSLYAGGGFTRMGEVAAGRVARWDGAVWTALGAGLGTEIESSPGTVRAIAPKANGVFVVGYFEEAGGRRARFAAWWDGAQWHALGEGTNDIPEGAVVYDGALWVGGGFTQAGSQASTGIGRWDYRAP